MYLIELRGINIFWISHKITIKMIVNPPETRIECSSISLTKPARHHQLARMTVTNNLFCRQECLKNAKCCRHKPVLVTCTSLAESFPEFVKLGIFTGSAFTSQRILFHCWKFWIPHRQYYLTWLIVLVFTITESDIKIRKNRSNHWPD